MKKMQDYYSSRPGGRDDGPRFHRRYDAPAEYARYPSGDNNQPVGGDRRDRNDQRSRFRPHGQQGASPAPRDPFDDWGDIMADDPPRRASAPRNDMVPPVREQEKSGSRPGADKGRTTKLILLSAALVLVVGGLVTAALFAVGVLPGGLANRGRAPLEVSTALQSLDNDQCIMLLKGYMDKSFEDTECEIRTDDQSATLRLSDFNFEYCVEKGAEREKLVTIDAETGTRTEELYARCGQIRYNRSMLSAFLGALAGEKYSPMTEPSCEIDYDKAQMRIIPGRDGYGIDIDTFINSLIEHLASGDSSPIYCTVGDLAAQPVDIVRLHDSYCCPPRDAYSVAGDDGEVDHYVVERIGVDFDIEQVRKAYEKGGPDAAIDITISRPKVDIRELRKYDFPDILSDYYTTYNAGDTARSSNIALAASFINGTVLEPGAQFSYNGTVGERTKERGFRKAGVYSNEGSDEDYGGGICQTSSTLYYTCILANMKIDERRNHTYTVGYMRSAKNRTTVYGNDATVNWGLIDYKFTNSKEYPIKIEMAAEGDTLHCTIRGTADGYTADFAYEQLSEQPFKIKYMKPCGKKNQSGHTGRTVKVYRIVYYNGEEVERKLESTNTYKAMTKITYTDDIPAGFEYGVEYDQGYTPPANPTTPPTEPTTPPSAPPETPQP